MPNRPWIIQIKIKVSMPGRESLGPMLAEGTVYTLAQGNRELYTTHDLTNQEILAWESKPEAKRALDYLRPTNRLLYDNECRVVHRFHRGQNTLVFI